MDLKQMLEFCEKSAIRVIREAEKDIGLKKMVFAWSGGRDSTVMLHLSIRALGKKIMVMFNDTGVEFPETYDFINKVVKLWNLKRFIRTKPKTSFWQLLKKRDLGYYAHFRKCCSILKERPGWNWMKEKGITHMVTGRKLSDSKCRRVRPLEKRNNWPKYTYVNPLWNWMEVMVRHYTEKYQLPTNPLYEMGYDRTGCWVCPCPNAAIDYYGILADQHPRLYYILLKLGKGESSTFYRHKWRGSSRFVSQYNHKIDHNYLQV